MSKNKTVLGRGLGALLSGVTTEQEDLERQNLPGDDGRSVGTICAIDIARVRPNPFQPRVDFGAQALDELKHSILENGVIQPITVRRVDGGFELISGERRVRASIAAGLTDIPAYILNVESDRGMLELALIENVQRENLNPIEVALGYQRLLRECSLTQEEVSHKVGKDRSTVTNFLRLLKLPAPIQSSLRNNEISMGHARALVTIPEDGDRLEVWRKVRDEGLSVRRTEALVKQVMRQEAVKAKERVTSDKPQRPTDVPARATMEVMYTEIANRMQHVLGTQVRIKGNPAGDGSLVIDFYTSEDLERLLDLFAIIERQNR
ncbi:MAG: ParB family chromosome partitioning protein [Chlorobi bacterium]|nr:ParB family chromosome partitioning protein [Chlorobiota bacterium]